MKILPFKKYSGIYNRKSRKKSLSGYFIVCPKWHRLHNIRELIVIVYQILRKIQIFYNNHCSLHSSSSILLPTSSCGSTSWSRSISGGVWVSELSGYLQSRAGYSVSGSVCMHRSITRQERGTSSSGFQSLGWDGVYSLLPSYRNRRSLITSYLVYQNFNFLSHHSTLLTHHVNDSMRLGDWGCTVFVFLSVVGARL